MRNHQTDRGARGLAVAIALLLSLSLVGCYTMLSHPRSEEVVEPQYSDSCLRCHAAEEDLGTGVAPWVEYYTYSSYPWINYYGSPWWYDSVWYWYDDCDDCPPGDDSGSRPELSGRQAWGRRPRGGWTDGVPERERTSSAFGPIVAPPVAPATPPAGTSSPAEEAESSQETEEKKDPRGRKVRR